jgi:hexulose-6-phosphate isomerase
MECTAWQATPAEAEAARERAAEYDLQIHSVMRGWCNVNSPDPAQVEQDLDSVRHSLRTARLLGADAVLLVPCRIGGHAPDPWAFDYEFDPATCHVTRVAGGDNAPYAEFIAAHNQATEASRAALEKLIPAAEAEGVVIAVENVWNNLWVMPDIFAAFVRSLKSPWIQAYLDLGNHVRYAPTEAWVRALGPLLAKCHVKDFTLNPNGQGGDWADIRDGSVDWPTVYRALRDVGYNGWMTIEGSDGLSMAELNRRLDLIISGQ